MASSRAYVDRSLRHLVIPPQVRDGGLWLPLTNSTPISPAASSAATSPGFCSVGLH
jgi:hypothetical protein